MVTSGLAGQEDAKAEAFVVGIVLWLHFLGCARLFDFFDVVYGVGRKKISWWFPHVFT